jgi:AraC family transcriptional regulator of adaptative response/methylated-DNA-[protein]-cysteine methyltransferase
MISSTKSDCSRPIHYANCVLPLTTDFSVATLFAARIDTPLGMMTAVACDAGIVLLEFVDNPDYRAEEENIATRLGSEQGPAVLLPDGHPYLSAVKKELVEYFAGGLRTFTVPLAPSGSDFERQAWGFLQSIPYGQTRTYGDQARGIGAPHASRAVGRANGLNRIAIIIPCHRVIGANGNLTGYASGLHRKRWLLDHEQIAVGDLLFSELLTKCPCSTPMSS